MPHWLLLLDNSFDHHCAQCDMHICTYAHMGFRLEILMLLMHNVRHVGSHKTVQTKRSQSKVKPDHFSSSPQCTGYGNGICPPLTLLLTSDFRVTNKKLILFNDPQTDDMSYMISTQFYLIWDKNSKKENVWFFHVIVLDRARDSEYKKVGHENELFRPCHCH